MNKAAEYKKAIAEALERTDNISILDLVYQLLIKSDNREKGSVTR